MPKEAPTLLDALYKINDLLWRIGMPRSHILKISYTLLKWHKIKLIYEFTIIKDHYEYSKFVK
jgi:hypothetical protein